MKFLHKPEFLHTFSKKNAKKKLFELVLESMQVEVKVASQVVERDSLLSEVKSVDDVDFSKVLDKFAVLTVVGMAGLKRVLDGTVAAFALVSGLVSVVVLVVGAVGTVVSSFSV